MVGDKPIAQVYESKKDKQNKSNIRAQVVMQHPELYMGPIILNLLFYLPRPKAHMGKKGVKASSPKAHMTKPDLDNLEKAVMDALTGVCWVDDRLIVGKSSVKRYADEQYPPSTEIYVTLDN